MGPPVPVGTSPAAHVEFTKLPMSLRSLHALETEDEVQLLWEVLLGPVPAHPATKKIRPPAQNCVADQFILAAGCHTYGELASREARTRRGGSGLGGRLLVAS
jgi:hypothetical protein